MFSTSFYVWSLLPLVLLGLFVWAFLKPIFGVGGREPKAEYLKQFLFTAVILALSEILINSSILRTLEGYLSFILPEGFLNWLAFPFLLLLGAQIPVIKKKGKSGQKKSGKIKK